MEQTKLEKRLIKFIDFVINLKGCLNKANVFVSAEKFFLDEYNAESQDSVVAINHTIHSIMICAGSPDIFRKHCGILFSELLTLQTRKAPGVSEDALTLSETSVNLVIDTMCSNITRNVALKKSLVGSHRVDFDSFMSILLQIVKSCDLES